MELSQNNHVTSIMITDINQLDLNKRYTYADYLAWQFKERVELIKGKVFKMSPAPSDEHQRISGAIHGIIWPFLRNHPCQVRHAPYDVRLAISNEVPISEKRKKAALPLPDDQIETVVQPDITVICDPGKIDKKGCIGSPDLVIEILSEGNNKADVEEKFNIYEDAGITEYWIVHPTEQTITVYALHGKKYIGSKPYAAGETIRSRVLRGLDFEVAEVFEG